MAGLGDRLDRRLRAIDGVEQGESAFGSGAGYWVGGKEILHFDSDDVVDVRLTRGEIRRRRDALRADERVRLRRSSSADWIEVRFDDDAVELVVELVRIAAAAHRPPPGMASPPPPAGPDLERRRRFH